MDTRRACGMPNRKLLNVLEGLRCSLLPVKAKCNTSSYASRVLAFSKVAKPTSNHQPITSFNIITKTLRFLTCLCLDTCSTEAQRITLFSRLGWKTEMLMARILALASRSRIPPASMNRVKLSSARHKPAFIAHA